MNGEFLENRRVLEGLEYFPVQLVTQIHVAFDAVRETKVNDEIPFVACFDYFRYHVLLQWWDLPRWTPGLNQIPIFEKLVLVQIAGQR